MRPAKKRMGDRAPANSSVVRKKAPRNQRVSRPSAVVEAPREPRPQLKERVLAARAIVLARWEKLRRPLSYVAYAAMAVAAAGLLVWAGKALREHLLSSPAFEVDTIAVTGLARLQRQELLEAAGVKEGANVFALGPEEVRENLLRHPWIASARVGRKLPGSFTIEVQEREPVALLMVEACLDASREDAACDDDSSLYLVSDEAKVFKRLDAEDPVDLPVITGVDRERFGGDRYFRDHVLLEAIALLQEYRALGLSPYLPIGEIHVQPGDGFSLYVGQALTLVRLGGAPFGPKLKRMKKVFARLSREGATADYVYLDNVTHPDRVTVRLR